MTSSSRVRPSPARSASLIFLRSQPAEVVWEEVKVSLSKQATGPLEVDEALMAAIGKVEGRTVTATVESFDQKSSRLTVDATHFGVADGEVADQVTKQLIKDIEANAGL